MVNESKVGKTITFASTFSGRFDLLEKHGCTTELASRLTYAYDKVIYMQHNMLMAF